MTYQVHYSPYDIPKKNPMGIFAIPSPVRAKPVYQYRRPRLSRCWKPNLFLAALLFALRSVLRCRETLLQFHAEITLLAPSDIPLISASATRNGEQN